MLLQLIVLGAAFFLLLSAQCATVDTVTVGGREITPASGRFAWSALPPCSTSIHTPRLAEGVSGSLLRCASIGVRWCPLLQSCGLQASSRSAAASCGSADRGRASGLHAAIDACIQYGLPRTNLMRLTKLLHMMIAPPQTQSQPQPQRLTRLDLCDDQEGDFFDALAQCSGSASSAAIGCPSGRTMRCTSCR